MSQPAASIPYGTVPTWIIIWIRSLDPSFFSIARISRTCDLMCRPNEIQMARGRRATSCLRYAVDFSGDVSIWKAKMPNPILYRGIQVSVSLGGKDNKKKLGERTGDDLRWRVPVAFVR